MQTFGLHKCIYTLSDRALRQERLDYYHNKYGEAVKKWEALKSEGVSDGLAQAFTGISRATYYRYKAILINVSKGIFPISKAPRTKRKSKIPQSVKDLILKIRLENQTYGKAKIWVIIKRDHGIKIGESTVGRILADLLAKGKIKPSCSAFKAKRKRVFKKHAKPWQYGMRGSLPGHMVQVDHMSVTKCSKTVKHFQAWDPKSKALIAEVYSNATSRSARNFLNKLIAEAPFPIYSIQVDGGSEFMLHFEEECERRGIELYVLPPKRPQFNGGVERGNRIFREEFYARDDVGLDDGIDQLRVKLAGAVNKHNTYRPHASLKGLTPFEYTQTILKDDSCSALSHFI